MNRLCKEGLHDWVTTVTPSYQKCNRRGCKAVRRALASKEGLVEWKHSAKL